MRVDRAGLPPPDEHPGLTGPLRLHVTRVHAILLKQPAPFIRFRQLQQLLVILPMIVFLDHLVRTLLALLLFIEKHSDLGACLRLVQAELLRQLNQRQQDQLTHLLDLSHRLETYRDQDQHEED